MILKLGNIKFDIYNGISVTLSYDSIASLFSASLFFDPSNALHKQIFRPLQYLPATIEHNGETLITGYALSHGFESGAIDTMVSISGSSITGVLEDCEIPVSAYPLQSNGLNLREIAEKVCGAFKLKAVVDPVVSDRVNQKYTSSIASDTDRAKEYLCELANQKNIIITHDEQGNVLLTEAKTKAAPIYDFSTGAPVVRASFPIDGQKMHSSISVVKQAAKSGKGNAGQAVVNNPYCPAYRPKVMRQTSGGDVDTGKAARNVLSDELKAMPLTLELDRWELNGKIIRPNNIITIQDPKLFLYNKTKFFIEQVTFTGNEKEQKATLTCYLPEVYNNEVPKNIFE